MEFARYQFEMSSKQSDGSSLKDHVQKAENNPFGMKFSSKDEKLEEYLEPPELPAAASLVWSWFLILHNTRPSGGFGGFFPLSHSEMKAFFELEQIDPEPWEIELLRAFDRVCQQVSAEQQSEEQKKQERQNKKR